jgi:hypothetical protein
MRILQTTLLSTLILFFAVGCGPRLRDFDEVEQAFDNPTGTLDSSNAGALFGEGVLSTDTYGLSSVAGNFDDSGVLKFALSSVDAALASRRDPLIENCNVNVKFNRSGDINKIVVDCTAEGNDPQGKLVILFDWAGNGDLNAATIHFQNWCEASGASCIDGWMGLKSEISGAAGSGVTERYLLVVNFDVQEGGSSRHLEYALRETFTDTTAEVELLVYFEGGGETVSFVFAGMVSPSGGHLEIRAANGSFVCDYSVDGNGDATSGTCTASGDGTTITWSAS